MEDKSQNSSVKEKAHEAELLSILAEGEGFDKVEAFKIPVGARSVEIVIAVSGRCGFPAVEGFLFLEDEDAPQELSLNLTEEKVRGKVFHVHRAKQIEVTIFYQGTQKQKQFPPSVRVQRVLDWAVGPKGFNIDPAVAPEMELALHGEADALPKNAHIGRYVRHPHHKLALDLIRGVVPNGAP